MFAMAQYPGREHKGNDLAEGEGFEPPVPFRVQRFSRPPVSTTHTSLRYMSPSVLRLDFLRINHRNTFDHQCSKVSPPGGSAKSRAQLFGRAEMRTQPDALARGLPAGS